MKQGFFFSVGFASMLATNAWAGTMGPEAQPWGWVASLSLGPVWASSGDTQTFFLTPTIEKAYVAGKDNQALANGELFVGIQRPFLSFCQAHVGLALAALSNTKITGIIWDDADPTFDNYSYQYNIQGNRVAARARLFFDKGYWLTPWISASLGVAFNRAHDFSNTPLIFEAITNPNFTNGTSTAFSYTLGIGLEKCLNEHWHVGLGYEFADWGKSELGRAPGQSLNSGLTLNHLYTNGLLFNLTYFL